ncbi:SusD/RagB family nutrient-binding outer membrane lipoprotein [Lewinella sp. IMCC34183]|uniref:SusD/RagB family nutrient-binding outer membrane lipoprotein n=1 Tax=Lewinella sp. IMCC34183 TaxID=2248762 RepID=UPI000E24FE0F|nr:SusD/RagB family nutrient-binding outer membrane lipoprotein [Lewinella sp. IMCC34183]
MTRIFLATLVAFGLSSCTDDFAEINTNPNSPTEVPTSYLFTEAEGSLVADLVGEGGLSTIGQHYAQYLSQTQYTDVTRYNSVESSFYGIYSDGLQDLQTIINLNTDPASADRVDDSGSNANQIALATILLQWGYLNVTDIWGDVPYSEALQGAENFSPVYDEQEQIYRSAVEKLVMAGDMIEAGTVTGDLIYNGDMEAYRLFANSLILRAGLRVANVAPALGEEWTKLALSRGVFTSNDDNAQLVYAGTGGLGDNTWFVNYQTRSDYAVSAPVVNTLQELNDPRLMVYARPTANTANTANPQYVGKVYGVTEAVALQQKNADTSFPGLDFVGRTAPAVILTYSEVLFNQAEAAARGWIDGDAEELYNAAITASMNQWGITNQTAIDSYLAQEDVAYDSDNFEMSIGNQKWLSLYFQGLEGWAEYRRLGYPDLMPAPAALLTDQIPRRRGYTVTEFSLNRENYNAAIERQFGGEDTLDGRIWWDVE